ncbi:HEAT repeat domain-containing protein [Roseofilum reptotaenium CS-1145]|uniref:Phycocyanin operon protein Z n=1 Tax=Roseofilum reptotaenium AO1-A TaxID=1925591 RepID=A0A1L9QLJ7_9CYAN|nr:MULTISPECIES: HEAT repeat domain-containing protein [Roseofilum]MBP0030552.1 HEAT repeat domain-containing protein [Roseofilum sp. Guam]MDB9516944.1 HEAT repeat domain-containing protein [Roseofilum reptotaenium CS-1145]OJJ19756.1 phycocyanin operon protein Z [Roseofilum reptotaenium AO1-A]
MTSDTNALFTQLTHPNPNLRERAMVQLAENRDEDTIGRLIEMVKEENVDIRRPAVKALGVIGPDAIVPIVSLLESSDNSTIQTSCVKALAQVAVNHGPDAFPEEGVDGLKLALNHPNQLVNITAVMALGAVGSPMLELLVDTLKTTENVALGVSIINALASMGDARATEVLTQLANDESADTYIRESATNALPRLEQTIQYSAGNS